MGFTAAPWSLPYPDLSDPDNVPADMQELCDRLQVVLPTLQLVSEEGQPNGYASLDSTGKIPAAQLPAAAGGGTILRKTTEKDVVNTSALTDLLNGEITVPAGAMSATGRIRLVAGGDYLNNTGGGKGLRVRLTLGGIVIWDATSSGSLFAADVSRSAWWIETVIQALGSVTAQRATGLFVLGNAAAVPVATTGVGGISKGDAIVAPFSSPQTAVNMGAAQALALSIAHGSANAALSMRLEHAWIEVA